MKLAIVVGLIAGSVPLAFGLDQSLLPEQSFDQTDGILERALAIEDIEYQIMVQRATQTAIWAMPAAGIIDFLKGIRRDLDGDLI